MSNHHQTKWIAALLLLVAAAPPVGAQSGVYSHTPFEETPTKLDDPRSSVPRLSFLLEAEIPLPGPLPGDPPRLGADGRVEVPVAGGLAVTGFTAGSRPELMPMPGTDGEPETDWVVDPAGTRRFRTEPAGRVSAERCCTWFRQGWRRAWRLRVAGGTIVPPLVTAGRVYVGALDNQVYAVRARNGHRLWTTDVGQRVTNPLALWTGPLHLLFPTSRPDREREVRLILVVLDGGDGTTLLALDSGSGAKVATFELPAQEGRMIGAPLATSGGEVLVTRQSYTKSDAALMVFRFTRPAPANDEPSAPPPG